MKKVKIDKTGREEQIERNIREAVARCSHANINLQQGRFITREDLEKIREKNLAHDFTKSR